MKNQENASPKERRKLLRAVRKLSGITLVELGKAANLSQPMLTQFERGDRDLSPEAWGRMVSALGKLIVRREAKRREQGAKLWGALQEEEKAELEALQARSERTGQGPGLRTQGGGTQLAENDPKEMRLTLEQAERIREKANETLRRVTTPEEDAKDLMAAFVECRAKNKELRETVVELRDMVTKLMLMIPHQGPTN
jgi:transcriptional regulator with XRE-family HTH domain